MVELSYQEDPSIQSINDKPRTILYLQEEHRIVEWPPAMPIICCTLCDERGHYLEEYTALEIIHRWYPIERVYYVGLRVAQFTCPLCTDNHLLEDCHYIPCFQLALASLCSAIVCLSQEDNMDVESTSSSMTQADEMSGSIMFLTAEERPSREPLVTHNNTL